jgi:hypothetical protein
MEGHHEALQRAITDYKQALTAWRNHQAEKAKRSERLREPATLARFQAYLDQTATPALRILPTAINESLQAWGDSIDAELGKTHEISEQLQQHVYETLTEALYRLGMACVDWIAPRADLSPGQGLVKPAIASAGAYRKANIDGIEVLTTDGPFMSGLAKRLGVATKDIYRDQPVRVSAFEQAYWSIEQSSYADNREHGRAS